MKVVINKCYGGFGLSDEAWKRYNELSGKNEQSHFNLLRDDPYLVQVVEELGTKANDNYSELHIVEIPDGISWHVEEYDGKEWIAETHRTWC